MQQDNGMLSGRFAKTNKEIGMGSNPDSSDGELNVLELLKNLNHDKEMPSSQL